MSSGVWDVTEYAKLPPYDADMASRPRRLFQCHQTDVDSVHRRICAGWAGCHGKDLLALRLVAIDGRLNPETVEIAASYSSLVPLFASGAEAAAHGLRDVDSPSVDATPVPAGRRR